jgi:signal transduction histidine kinase
MRILLFITAFFICGVVKAQNTEADSLKNLLHTTKDDKQRVVIFEGLSYAYLGSYPDTALQYAVAGLDLAKEIGFARGEAVCTNALGNVYFHIGNNAKALEMYLRYLKLKEGLKNEKNFAVAYFNIAGAYTEEGDYRHALDYIFKAKLEDEKIKDTSGILFDLFSLGNIYLRMEKADSALYYITHSYRLSQLTNEKNMIGAILNTFGDTYLLLHNTDSAMKYYNLSIPYAEAINDNEVLTSDYYGLAKVYKEKKLPDSSIHFGRKALSIAREAPFLKQVLEISTFVTGLFSAKNQYDSAFYYQRISMSTRDSLFNVEQVKKVQNLKFQEQQRQQGIETARIKFRNKVRLFIVIFISLVFLVIAFILWRNNKQKQKANALLKQQKEKIENTLKELRSTQAQLIQSEKMASLGELTAGIAHEIQNPLNFVNNFSEINAELIDDLKTELATGNQQQALEIADSIKDNEEKINHHGKRADAIVKGMLQHSRAGTAKKEPTDINALADEYLRLSYHGLRAKDKSFNAVMQTDFDESIGKINIVPQDIGRVLLNLYNNAFYACTERSRSIERSRSAVMEKAKKQPGNYEPTVSVSTKKRGDNIELTVRDNGNGIPEKITDKIFQPFFTTKPTGEGTGLGLSLSYDIIKAHGGDISVRVPSGKAGAKENEGAEFIIRLPIYSF